MKKEKKHWTDDFPHYPDNYRDHRTYIYRLTETKIQTHPNKSMEGKYQWSVVQYRNVMPPRIVNLWSFSTKVEAESFMQKHDFVVPSKQN